MDTVEIVVEGRKGVNEHKALKILGKFLKQDQEKDVDDQLPADVLHQLQQIRDSLEGKEVKPLVLSTLAASSSASPATPQQQKEEDGEAAGAEADEQEQEQEPEPEPETPKSETKHKKKRHKKE